MSEEKNKDIIIEEIEEEIIEDEDYITLEFDDDTAVDCLILGVFECEGKEYIAFAPDDGTDDVYIYGYAYHENDEEFEIKEIDDEEEFNKAVAEFEKQMEEE